MDGGWRQKVWDGDAWGDGADMSDSQVRNVEAGRG